MGMGLEDGDDFKVLPSGGLKVIVDVTLGIDDGGFTLVANKVGCVSETLNEESLFDHAMLIIDAIAFMRYSKK